jgi:WD40 repeat protein/S1-C subfamily serine protease
LAPLFFAVLFAASVRGLATDWPDLLEQARRAVVYIEVTVPGGAASGSGALISPDGYILTAAHVVEYATRIAVVVEESDEYLAAVVAFDREADIAVLKIQASGLTWLALGDSGALLLEEEVRLLGYPRPGIGFGLVIGTGQFLGARQLGDTTLLQIDVSPFDHGHSGGPIIAANGDLVGVAVGAAIFAEQIFPDLKTDSPYLVTEYRLAVSASTAKQFIPSYALPTGPSPVQPRPPVGLARFSLTDISVIPSPPFTSDTEATISAQVTNTGAVAGTKSVWLLIDEQRLEDTTLALVAGERQAISFKHVFATAGTYSVGICTPDGCSDPLALEVKRPPIGASFSVDAISVEGSLSLVPGVAATVSARVYNVGDFSGTKPVWLEVDGVRIAQTSLSLAPGERHRVSFAYTFEEPGAYTALIRTSDSQALIVLPIRGPEPVRILDGPGPVVSVAFSPDGRLLASGAGATVEYEVRLWEVRTGTLIRILSHAEAVYSVAFAPDGRLLATGSEDGVVRLWDVESGELVRTLAGHESFVKSVAFSPDGTLLVSGSGDTTVRLWEVATGAVVWVVGHAQGVTSVAFSPGGSLIASGSVDRTVRIWDVETGGLIRNLSGHEYSLESVAFSPDGRSVASGAWQEIRLWDVSSGTLVRTLGHADYIYLAVVFSPDGKTLAAGTDNGHTELWDVATGKSIRYLSGHGDWRVYSVAFAPDGRTIASGAGDYTVKLWDVGAGTLVRTLTGHNGCVKSVAFSPDGRLLTSGGSGRSIVWDTGTASSLLTLTGGVFNGHKGDVLSVAFSPDGKTLASGSQDTTIKLWEAATGELLRTLSGHTSTVFSVVFSPDRRTLASGSYQEIKLWDASSGAVTRTFALPRNSSAYAVAFSPDGRILATGLTDNTAKLWDVATGKELCTLSGHAGSVSSVAFSPDGKALASGSYDNRIKLWDVGTAKELRTLSGHTDFVHSIAFSPDGKTLASGSGDCAVKLWDVVTGSSICTLYGHTRGVNSVTFSPSGETLASGSNDTTIGLWDVSRYTGR